MTVHENHDVIAFKSCIQIFTVKVLRIFRTLEYFKIGKSQQLPSSWKSSQHFNQIKWQSLHNQVHTLTL